MSLLIFLSLLVTKLHPSAPIVLGLPWLRSTNPTIDWSALSLTFKTGPRSALPSLALARACSTAALRHQDIISNLSPAFDSIPELRTASGPSIPTKVVLIMKMTSSVKLGPFSSNSAPPLGSIPWNRPGFVPPELMHSWDPLSPWFSASDKFSPTAGGVPTPATIFPLLQEDHVNNHLSLGVPPPNTDTRTLCQVEVIPCKSEGIEPFNLVNSPPGQVEDASSHPINSPSGPVEDASSHMVNFPPCQVGVYTRKSEGIEPFTLVNSPPGQVEDASSHTVNSPPYQVGVYPRKSEGIEPFNLVNSLPGQVEDADVSSHMVNSPPCQVRALPSHLINSPSGSLGVSSPVSCTVPASVSDRCNHQAVPQSSLRRRRMAPCDSVWTSITSTRLLERISSRFHLSPTSSTNWAARRSTPS